MERWRRIILTTAVVGGSLLTGGASEADPLSLPAVRSVRVVIDGLDNPRNLAFGQDGDLYIPAAGTGGNEGCGIQQEGYFCSGLKGSVLRASADSLAAARTDGPILPTTVADRLVSMAWPGGTVGHGVHAVVTRGDDLFALFIGPEFLGVTGSEECCREGVSPELRAAALSQLGNLMKVAPDGTLSRVADVDHFEFSQNPINSPHANPYDVAVDVDGSFLVVDAAGNTLLRVHDDGAVDLVAVFPNMPTGIADRETEAVPTGIAVGPGGDYYVSLLGGFNPGAARIVRVRRATGAIENVAAGMTMLTNLEVAGDGTIYATAIDPGAVVRLRPDPNAAGIYLPAEFIGRGELVAPTGIDIAPDGSLYVSDTGVLPGGIPAVHGRVVRIAEPASIPSLPATATPILTGPGSFYGGYVPTVALVQQGASWTLANLDTAPHDLCSVRPGTHRGHLFCSDVIHRGEIASVEGTDAIEPGMSYEFVCTIHPATMKGVVVGLHAP